MQMKCNYGPYLAIDGARANLRSALRYPKGQSLVPSSKGCVCPAALVLLSLPTILLDSQGSYCGLVGIARRFREIDSNPLKTKASGALKRFV